MNVKLRSGSDAVFCVSRGLVLFWESLSQRPHAKGYSWGMTELKKRDPRGNVKWTHLQTKREGCFFDLVWLLLQRMATRSKVIILPKSEVLSDRIGCLHDGGRQDLWCFRYIICISASSCSVRVSSFSLPAEGGRRFWCLILGPLMVARPLARQPHSVVPRWEWDCSPLLLAGQDQGSVWGSSSWDMCGPVCRTHGTPIRWGVGVALHLQKMNFFSSGVTPSGGHENSRFIYGKWWSNSTFQARAWDPDVSDVFP